MASNNGGNMKALEVEPLASSNGDTTEQQQQQQPPPLHPMMFVYNGWRLLCMYIDYYRAVTFPVGAFLLIVAVILGLESIAYHSTKSHVAVINHDYTDAHSVFELKMKQIDHWCLSGGDDDCRCDDPTMGNPSNEVHGWTHAHKANKQLLDTFPLFLDDVDVVFLGDEFTEEWNGRWVGKESSELTSINKYFNKTFTRAGGGDVDGVALGIAGDSVSNLLWRLQHGEMPTALNPKVWWITIGANDLDKGQCAEEPTLLGILRLAEYVATAKPGSMIVLNSVLPRMKQVKPSKKAAHAFKPFDLYPSIKVVNEQLDKFCKKHSEFQFFDATEVFLNVPHKKKGSKHKSSSTEEPTMKDGLIDSDGKVSTAGHKAWGKLVVEEVKRIMYDDMYQYGPSMLDDMFTDDYSN